MKDKGTSGEASVELQNGTIEKISVFSLYVGLPGKPGYSCTLEVGRKDTDTKWVGRGDTIEIEFESAPEHGAGDSMSVSQTPRGFVLDLSKTRSSGLRCGAGAQLPQRVTISKTSKTCRTIL